ncbi:MAG: hypothetical protein B6226_00015 [Candidatus Cloacimonetes bacterium 4572_65]|nr:MAG: hypothetical protein B6226_00015 [Candidatus Cloacimonetes bacterium 4572_65]
MNLSRGNKALLVAFSVLWIITGLWAYSKATHDDLAQIELESEQGYENNLTQRYQKQGGGSSSKSTITQDIAKLYDIIRKLDAIYVDEVDSSKLIEDAINGMLKELDPHTTYFTAEEFETFTSSTKGEFGGLGIQIDKKGDYITVVSPIEGTPAFKMGIMAGDMIWKVDGEDITGISTTESITKMRGEIGTKVVVTVIRPGVKEPLEFAIIRDVIAIKSVPYSFKLDNGVGYVRMTQFNAHTTEELVAALDELEEQDIKGLILDLRFNPGGLLSEAVNTVNEFVGPNKRVVYTKGKIAYSNDEYLTEYDTKRPDYPVIVLINEASASASEIFAGSLQDYDRGLVMGKTSFGKGSVQQLFPLADGSGIKITTSHYYINSGRCIHKTINDKLLTGKKVTEKEKEDIEKSNHEHIYKTEKGRIVYGGGGVTPDIEVQADTLSKFELELRRKNLFFNFAVDFMLKNSRKVKPDFTVSNKTFDNFVKFMIKTELAEQKEIEEKEDKEESKKSVKPTKNKIDLAHPTAEDLAHSEEFIKLSLTSEIIEKKYGNQESYKIRIAMDSQLQEAKKLFDDYNTLQEMFDYASSLKKEEGENE